MANKAGWTGAGELELNIDGTVHKFKLIPTEEQAVQRFAAKLADLQAIGLVLTQARNSFSNGKADYYDAAKNLLYLLESLVETQKAEIETVRSVASFFHPGNLLEVVGSEPEDLDMLRELCQGVIDRLLKPMIEAPENGTLSPETPETILDQVATVPATVKTES